MTAKVRCPHCGIRVYVSTWTIHTTERCHGCGRVIYVHRKTLPLSAATFPEQGRSPAEWVIAVMFGILVLFVLYQMWSYYRMGSFMWWWRGVFG